MSCLCVANNSGKCFNSVGPCACVPFQLFLILATVSSKASLHSLSHFFFFLPQPLLGRLRGKKRQNDPEVVGNPRGREGVQGGVFRWSEEMNLKVKEARMAGKNLGLR